MTEPKELQGEPRRQAVASFTGAAYQAWHSIDAWLRLQSDDEVIFLEGAEDFDHVGSSSGDTAVQVRHTREPISLASRKALEALENFWQLVEREPARIVHMHYVTTSGIARERDGVFGDLAGLDAWRAARTNGDLAKAVGAYVTGKLSPTSSLRQFLESSAPEQLQDRLLKRFSWFTDQPDVEGVQQSVDDRLASILAGMGRSVRLAEKVRPHLESAFWRAVREKQSAMRRLTRGGLLRVLDDALTTYLTVPVESATELLTLPLPGMALLDLLREKVPHPPEPLLPRTQLVEDLRRRIGERQAIFLTGSVFKGKTTIAQLTAHLVCPDAVWIPLSGRTIDQVSNVLSALSRQIDADAFPSLILIDDLDVSAAALRALRSSLLVLLHRASECGRGLVVTAQGSALVTPELRTLPTVQVVEVPELSEGEIEELCLALGCPKESARATAVVTHALTRGHPKLVQIRLAELSREAWTGSVVSLLTQQSPGELSAKQLARGLVTQTVPEKLSELLYAASEASLLLERTVLMTLAEALGISNPGDAIDALSGYWLECLERNWYRVTPLLSGAAAAAWTAERRQTNHLQLHRAIRAKGTLSPAEAAALLFHAYQSKAWQLVAMDAMRLQILDGKEAQDAVLRNLFWLPYFALAPSEHITGDRVSGASLRSLQFKVAVVLDTEVLPAVCDRWVDEAQQMPVGEMRDAMLVTMWSSFVSAESAKVPLRLRLKAVEELSTVGGHAGRLLAAGLQKAFSGERVADGVPSDPDTVGLTLLLVSRWIRSEHALREFVDWLASSTDRVRAAFDLILDWPLVQTLGAVVHGAWSTDHESVKDWTPWLKLFDDIAEYAGRHHSPRFGVEAAKAKSIILAEELGESEPALQVLFDAEKIFGRSVVLEEQRANVLFHGKDDTGVLKVWEELKSKGASALLNDPYAYRRAGISAGRLALWDLAVEMFGSGAQRASVEGFELTRFGMLIDQSLSLYMRGDVIDAVRHLSAAVSNLPPAASREGELRWEAVQRVASEVCGHFDKSTAGKASELTRVQLGDASSPSQKMKEPSAGQEARTYLLRSSVARVAGRLGISDGIDWGRLQSAPYQWVRFVAAEGRLALSISQGDGRFVDALQDYDRSVSQLAATHGDRGKLLERDGGPTDSPPTGMAWGEFLLAAAWCSHGDIFNWLEVLETRLLAASLAGPASCAKQIRHGALSGVRAAVLRDVSEPRFVRCGAALGQLREAGQLEERVRLQDFMCSALVAGADARFQEVWNLPIARHLASEIQPHLQNRFQFLRPDQTVAPLEGAVDKVFRGSGTLKTLSSAVHIALGLQLPASYSRIW